QNCQLHIFVHRWSRKSVQSCYRVVANPTCRCRLRVSQGGSTMPTVAEKRATFRRLHQGGLFVMPNPWDVGSARYLQGLGFKALATTSAGFAWARGLADGGVPRDMMLAHIAEMSAAADVPMNADFEGGYADAPADVAESVRLCVATGVSGLSI